MDVGKQQLFVYREKKEETGMSRQKKKFLSLLIIVCLLVTALPVQAGAAEADNGRTLYIGEIEENGNNYSNNSSNQELYNNENTENSSSETVNTDEENTLAVCAVDEENTLAAHAEVSGYWTDDKIVASDWKGGDGSQENPYQIETAAQLAYLAKKVNEKDQAVDGKYFKLTDDIDLSGHYWVPIGYEHHFDGYFDGGGHTITGLCIEEDLIYTYVGLFGWVFKASDDDEPVLKNIRIEKAAISGTFSGKDNQSGILAGRISVSSDITTKVWIENCSVAGTIDVKSLIAGGLCGGGAECEGDKLYVFCNCGKQRNGSE